MLMKQPFQFKDRRQERIHRRLSNIGAGPASFYRDACAMMNEGVVFEAQSHLVSHVVREIESALRDVLETLADRTERLSESQSPGDLHQAEIRAKLKELNAPETDPVAQAWLQSAAPREGGTSQHRKEIQAILKGLGIPDDDPTSKAWLGLVGKLHGKAHRDALARPRPLDEAFVNFWDTIQAILDDVLDRFERAYAKVYDQLDQLLAKPVPDPDDLELLKNNVPNNLVTFGYFFDRLASPQWLVPLRRKGFFRLPPAPERNEEEETIRFPSWPASLYLARMAAHDPQTVLEIIKETETENGRVYDDFADAMLAMPSDKAAKLIPAAKAWLDAPYQFLVGEKLGRLAVRLAQSEQISAALELARVLLMPIPDSRPERHRLLSPEAQPRIRDYHYEHFLKDDVPQLIAVSGLPTFELLCDALEEAVRLSRSRPDESGHDYSYVHRPAIEDHEQNSTRWGLPGLLITAVRNAAEQIAGGDSALVQTLVTTLEGHSGNVFRRLALHLLRTVPDAPSQLAIERLMDFMLFEEHEVWHEYGLLIRERFGNLTPEQQATIMGWLESGPDIEQWKVRKQEGDSEPPTAEEAAEYAKVWRITHIARLRDVLPDDWKKRHDELVTVADQKDHPDFLSYSGGVFWGPTSPKPADDMNAMTVPEIIDYLKGWEPTSDDFFGPTWEGLARTLTEVVQRDPERFARDASAFQQLDEPTYINGLLRGFYETAKVGTALHWPGIVALCEWVVSQPREIADGPGRGMDRDPDWSWTRQTIASLLEAGFRTGTIPAEHRFRVWGVLERLMADPDPTLGHEAQYGGDNMDPATMSLNTVRGRTMHAVMHYAFWLRRQSDVQAEKEPPQKSGMDLMPEVRRLLDDRLEPDLEPSATVRAVYGWYFPTLYWLDPKWAIENVARVFPEDPQYRALYEAAWHSFLAYGRGYGAAFDVLEKAYEFAVNELDPQASGGGVRPNDRLAEHIMWHYTWGKLPLDKPDGLLHKFFTRAGDKLRAHAVHAIGYHLHETKDPLPADEMDRLRALWEQRLETARASSGNVDELAAFGGWFASGMFDDQWSLRQLAQTLKVAGKADPYHQVLERLVELSAGFPKDAVECLDLLVQGDTKGWETTLWQEEKRSVLQHGLQSSDPAVQQAARDLINRLSALGQVKYRELLSS